MTHKLVSFITAPRKLRHGISTTATAGLIAANLILGACGGGGSGGTGGSNPPPAMSYTIGGTVTGLGNGTQVVLLDNGGDALTVSAAGGYAFATALASGATYAVTVGTQPAGETCTANAGSGTVGSANVTNVAIACTPGTSNALSGVVLTGPKGVGTAIAGAALTVWATGPTATQLQTGASQSDGTFAFNVKCPTPGTLLYVTATGGSTPSTGGNNPAIELATALGPCGSMPPAIVVNEATTAAVAYALNGFTTQANATAPMFQGKSPGIDKAFATAANLISAANGLPDSNVAVTNSAAAAQVLNSLSDALAACTQSNNAAGQSAACSELFNCARQRATYTAGSVCAAGNTPLTSNTLSAALAVTQNAGLVSMPGLFALSQQVSIFTPSLTAVPNDWTLLLSFAVNNKAIAPDGSGNLWVFSFNQPVTLAQITANGTATTYDVAGSGFANDSAQALGVDAKGNVWIGGVGQVAEYSPSGTLWAEVNGGPFTSADLTTSLLGSAALAFDASGNVWLADGNCCNNANNRENLVEINSAGSVVSGSNGYLLDNNGVGGTLLHGVAVDKAGNAWSVQGPTVIVTDNNGNQTGQFVPTDPNAYWNGIAIDQTGLNAWVTDYSLNSVWFLDASTSTATQYQLGGTANPRSVAVDAAGHAWIACAGLSAYVVELNPNGAPLAPATGYQSTGGIDGALTIAIDQAGNVWVGDGNENLYELVGAAAATQSPLVTAINQGFTP